MNTSKPPFVLLDARSGEEIAGETLSDIVDHLIPAHALVPDGDDQAEVRLALRAFELERIATQAQALVCASIDVSSLDDDAKTVIFHDRHEEVAEFEEWDSDIPLFLMATNYAPYTERPRPSGTVHFLDPHTERTFLESLQLAGVAELFVAPGAQLPAD